MRNVLVVSASLSVLFLSSCCSQGVKSVPSNITLKDALTQVSDGIQELQSKERAKKAGLVMSDVEVTFNITAAGDNSNTLKLDLAPEGIIKQIPTGGFEASSSNSLSRSNQIKVTFKNLLTASKDSVVGVVLAPQMLAAEKTVVTDKDGKTTTTEKKPELKAQMTLEQLYKWSVDNGAIIMTPPL